MKIGVPIEIKTVGFHVSVTPASVHEVVTERHAVIF
jgi:alanine dehydrogenase